MQILIAKEKEIYIYLLGDRNFEEGIRILSKYEKRKNFLRNMMRKTSSKYNDAKLHYSLFRMTTLPKSVLYEKKPIEVVQVGEPSKEGTDIPGTDEETNSGSGSSEDDTTEGSGSGESKPSEETESGSGTSENDTNEGSGSGESKPSEETESSSGAANNFPPLIVKMKKEIEQLSIKRSRLKSDLNKVGDENTTEQTALRKSYGDQIAQLSERLDFIAPRKEDFFKKGILPNEDEIYPKPASEEELTGIKLVKRERALVSSLTKDRNKLKYQQQTKADKENPMPKGPKRQKVEIRTKEKEIELESIRKKIEEQK